MGAGGAPFLDTLSSFPVVCIFVSTLNPWPMSRLLPVLLMVLFASGCTKSSSDETGTQEDSSARSDSSPGAQYEYGDLTVRDVAIQRGQNGVADRASGVVTNDADVATPVSLDITLLNAAGEVVGNAVDSVPSLSPGQVWRFDAIILEENVAVAEVTQIWSELE